MDLAQDAGQEAIVRALSWFQRNRTQRPEASADHHTSEESPSEAENERRQPSLSWLITIAMNVLHDWARSRQRMPNAADESLANLTAEEAEQPPEEYDQVIDALGRLPVRDREILEMILIQEMTPEDAAFKLGIGKWAGYKRYERALVRLREMLGSSQRSDS
jgi:RNA polymerase sigma factor (sigma-70 family)